VSPSGYRDRFPDSSLGPTGRYGKWLTDINDLLVILIRQMAALVRRAEACFFPVLLVNILQPKVGLVQ